MNSPADFRRTRLDRQLDLEQLSRLTALKPDVLRAIDDGRFELLPAGIYARAYVRSYASAVGLDPTMALRQVEHLLPAPPDPLPALRARNADETSEGTLNLIVARVTDALLLCGLDVAIVLFVSLASGVALDALLRSGGAVAVPCAVPMAAYFILFGAIAGRTPGEWLFNCPARPAFRIRVR